jgi:hypothetical protein
VVYRATGTYLTDLDLAVADSQISSGHSFA